MFTRKDISGTEMLVIVMIIFCILGIFIQPYFEAKSFNRLTGGNATYADAFWSELRVDGSSQVLQKSGRKN